MNVSRRIPLNGAAPISAAQRQRGQAMSEYLVITVALVAGGAGVGLFGDDGGIVGLMLDALRVFHDRFSMALSWPF